MRAIAWKMLLLGSCARGAPRPVVRPEPPQAPATRVEVPSLPAPVARDEAQVRAVPRGPEAPMAEQWQPFLAVSATEFVSARDGAVVTLPEGPGSVVALRGARALRVDRTRLTAYALPEGTVAWARELASPCDLTAANEQWFFCARQGSLDALRASDGEAHRWPLRTAGELEELVATRERAVVRARDGALEVLDPRTGSTVYGLPAAQAPLDRHVGEARLVVARDESAFCRVDRGERAYGVSCHDALGPQRFSLGPIVHTAERAQTQGGPAYLESLLYLSEVGRSTLLFGALRAPSPPMPGHYLSHGSSLRSGQQTLLAVAPPAGLLEGEDGALLGLFTREEQQLALRDAALPAPVRWAVPNERGADAVSAVALEEVVALASYHRIATGSALEARALRSGALRWRAEVVQLGVGHSEYSNAVRLFARDGTLVLYGREAGGAYVQGFDARTGQRRFAVLRRFR